MALILIADDEEPLRNLLMRLLEADGHRVLTAADGTEALSSGREHLDRIDLLIADIRMPGMEGTAVARLLKDERPDLKVLLISGYTSEQVIMEPFLPKPFAPDVLLTRVRELIGPAADRSR